MVILIATIIVWGMVIAAAAQLALVVYCAVKRIPLNKNNSFPF